MTAQGVRALHCTFVVARTELGRYKLKVCECKCVVWARKYTEQNTARYLQLLLSSLRFGCDGLVPIAYTRNSHIGACFALASSRRRCWICACRKARSIGRRTRAT